MKVFLDTNIIIDFYDKRGEFYYPAAIIFDLAYKGKIQLYVSATTFVMHSSYSENLILLLNCIILCEGLHQYAR